MTFENFKKALDTIRKYNNLVDRLSELGIEMEIDEFYSITAVLFEEIYGKEGFNWIDWYLYEQPHFLDLIKKEGDKPEYHAWEADGTPIDLSTDEKLWKMLEAEYAYGKIYHDNSGDVVR